MIMAKDSNNNYVNIEDIRQQNSFNGISPTEFKGNGENLENYRIYGNTVDGESVGDRTGNLFANLWKKGYIRADNGREEQIDGFICSGFFPVEYGQTYSISRNINVGYDNIRGYRDDKSFVGAGTDICDVGNPFPSAATNIGAFTVTNENVAFIRFNDSANDLGMKYMIVKGTYTKQTMPDYEPYGYKAPVTVSNGTDTLTTPIYLPEQIRKVGDEAEYVDYATQKQHRVRKNLLPNTATSQTINGVTFMVNSDGSVTCNGTASVTTWFALNTSFDIYAPDGRIVSIGNNGSTSTFYLNISYIGNITSSSNYSKNTHQNVYVQLVIASGYTCNNLTFYPMIRKADIEDDTYEPYIENTDVDVTLPALPTLSGTNTLSIETNTKPSKVWGKLSDLRDILYVKDNLGNILFSKYHEIEGEPPLIYKPKKADTLIDYRIYGNTVDGESVGDRTANLFNGELQNGYWSTLETLTQTSSAAFRSFKIFLPAGTYTITFATNVNIVRLIADGALTQNIGNNLTEYTVTTQTDGDIGFSFRLTGTTQVPWDNSDIMLNEGPTALPYEPCGYRVPVTVTNGTDTETTNIYLPKPIKMVGDEAEYIDYAEQKQHVDADEEIEKQATTYMVSITPKTDVSKIEFVTMSSVPDDCTILTSGLIFTLDEADANTLNSTNYADGVRGKASTAHNYKYTWTKRYTEGETYYIRSYVKYQTADNEIKEVYGDVYKADINGFERVRKSLHVTLPALPTIKGTNVLSVGTAVQPSRVYIKGKIKEIN